MFKRISEPLNSKFEKKSDLGRQLQIVKVFEIYKKTAAAMLPALADVKLISLKNKKLIVHPPSAAAAGELRMIEGEIIKKINEVMRERAVERVIYRF